MAPLPPSPTSPPLRPGAKCCCTDPPPRPPSGQSLAVALASQDPGPREGLARAWRKPLERLRPGWGQASGVDTSPPQPHPGPHVNEGPQLLLPVRSHRPRERPDDGPPAGCRGTVITGLGGARPRRGQRGAGRGPGVETPPHPTAAEAGRGQTVRGLGVGRSHSRVALRQGLHTRPPRPPPLHHALVAPLKATEQMRKRKTLSRHHRQEGAGGRGPRPPRLSACWGEGVALEASLTLLRDSPT